MITLLKNFSRFFLYQNLINFFLILIILSFPFNYKIFLFLRPQDFFVLGFILLQVKEINFFITKYVLLLLFFLTLSCFTGYLYYEKFYITKLAFFYKIIIPVIFTYLLLKHLKKIKIEIILNYCHFIFILYLLYVLLFYLIEPSLQAIFRVPYLPSSINYSFFDHSTYIYTKPDKHIMSAIVGFYLTITFTNFLINTKESLYKFYIIIFYVVIFYLFAKLFESRNLYLYLLLNFYFIFNSYFQNLISIKLKKIFSILFLLVSLIIMLLFINFTDYWFFYDLNYLFKIYISEVSEVGIHADRVEGFFKLLPDNLIPFLFGRGLISYEQNFLDSGLLFFLLNFGLIPLIIIINYASKNFYYEISSHSSIKILLLFSILINLFISEFFLVSRYIYVIIILFLVFDIKAKRSQL